MCTSSLQYTNKKIPREIAGFFIGGTSSNFLRKKTSHITVSRLHPRSCFLTNLHFLPQILSLFIENIPLFNFLIFNKIV